MTIETIIKGMLTREHPSAGHASAIEKARAKQHVENLLAMSHDKESHDDSTSKSAEEPQHNSSEEPAKQTK